MPAAGSIDSGDRVFSALASPVRREVLDLLRGGPRAAGEIAERFAMARPSVSEHLKVLRAAGLVQETRRGRHRVYAVDAEPLREVVEWLSPYEQFWRDRLGALRSVLDRHYGGDDTGDGA